MKNKGKSLRRAHKRRYFVASRLEGAAETIGSLRAGDEISGLTCGQFSMIDILEHMARESGGEAEVSLSTWTSGIYDIERAAQLRDAGVVRSAKFLMDRAMFSKSPEYAGPLIDAFGLHSFRDSSVHAKITIVRGRDISMVCRGSMNLNKNLKTEQFDISVCDEAVEFFQGWFDELWAAAQPDLTNEQVFQEVYDRWRSCRGEPTQEERARRDWLNSLPSAKQIKALG